jgi:hypothetical protein
MASRRSTTARYGTAPPMGTSRAQFPEDWSVRPNPARPLAGPDAAEPLPEQGFRTVGLGRFELPTS